MDDGASPDRSGGEQALVPAQSSVPAMPVIRPSERSASSPYPVLEGISRTIGWQFRPERRGGPVFVLMGRGAVGLPKVLERFPLTEAGWARAWQALVRENPDVAEKVRVRLKEREREQRELDQRFGTTPEIAELDSRSLASLRRVALLGGYAPGAAIVIGELYDARFLEDRLVIFPAHSWEARAEVPYSEVEDVEIGGPGLVKSGGGFVGGGFGAVGALEGMAIASVLNALTTRASVTTIVRVQAASCELFLLHTRSTPEHLRIELSRALGAIRAAKTAAAHAAKTEDRSPRPASPVEELAKLADMLQAGLLTRERVSGRQALSADGRRAMMAWCWARDRGHGATARQNTISGRHRQPDSRRFLACRSADPARLGWQGRPRKVMISAVGLAHSRQVGPKAGAGAGVRSLVLCPPGSG
jgi:hypothetical protein